MTTLAHITMNAGDDIAGATIKAHLRANAHRFSRVVVVDGHMTDQARAFYGTIPNLTAVDSPWADSYVTQYEMVAACLPRNEWCLYLDDDEWASPELVTFCNNLFVLGSPTATLIPTPQGNNIIRLPCVLHLEHEGKYVPAEPTPSPEYVGQWTKSILFKKADGLHFRYQGSHVFPMQANEEPRYVPYPYYHLKTLHSFVANDVYQAFLSPVGQGYTPVESAVFKLYLKMMRAKTTKEFRAATMAGHWPEALILFAWKKRWEVKRPISRLAWLYFVLCGHPMPEPDPLLTWENVAPHVQSPEVMERFRSNAANGEWLVV